MKTVVITALLFLTLSVPCISQTLSFKKVSYAFWDTVNLANSWHRYVYEASTVIVDTFKGQVTIPNLQLWAETSTRRNLLTGQTVNKGDTLLSIHPQSPVTMYFVGRPITYDIDGYKFHYANITNRLYCWWSYNWDGKPYVAITYPYSNGFSRLIEFEN